MKYSFQFPHVSSRLLFQQPYIMGKLWILSFFIPLMIRAIPEILAGAFPVGYDAISAYLPIMLDYGRGNLSGFHPMIGGWLIYGILGAAYSTSHLDPVLIIKVTAPIIYGLLGLSEYYFARNSLQWSQKKSFFFVLISSVYFVLLRMSWDLFSNTFGLSLLLVGITIGRNIATSKRAIIYSALVWLVTLTHLLVGTILVGIIAIDLAKSRDQRTRRLVCAIPGVTQYVLSLIGIQLLGVSFLEANGLGVQPVGAYAFPFYIFLPLLPLAAFGLSRVTSPPLKYWLLLCCIGIFFAGTPIAISHQIVEPDRWAFMMSLPLLAFAVEGLARSWSFPSFSPVRKLSGAWVLLILVFGISYIALPAQEAFPYYQFLSPTSMLQSSIPIQDSQALVNDITWLSNNIPKGAVFMTHHAMYGWAREYFHSQNPVVTYGPGTSLKDALAQTLAYGYTDIYTIWWINGRGWYGEAYVPSGFIEEHTQGEMAVYHYA